MIEFNLFNTELKEKLAYFSSRPRAEWEKTAAKYVNGIAEDELRRLVSLEKRRASGAFFTNDELTVKILGDFDITFSNGDKIYDPCCGAANMLICCGNVAYKTNSIINLWGTDIHSEFVEASEHRLAMLNILLENSRSTHDISIANGLQPNPYYANATHIVTNPPFNQLITEELVSWGTGKISAAALFIDKIISYIQAGTAIIAILPEVLRSGSRYEKWRRMVEQRCQIVSIRLLGQFDKFADVDVFAIHMFKRVDELTEPIPFAWIQENRSVKGIISDRYNICVGPVVDNRDELSGPARPFIRSRGLKGWQTVSEWTVCRPHQGRSFKSPFVVVKRTSRRGDSNRAIATVINISEDVFVDNHLIILQPKSQSLDDCQELIKKLNNCEIDHWLDQQIRCRHLTVRVVSNIPYDE